MDPVHQLLEIEAIKRLKARYFRLMDTKDWTGWLDLFTDDMVLEFDTAVSTGGRNGKPVRVEGKAAVAEFVPASLNAAVQTVHHGHMPEVELISETEARGVWAMEDIVDRGDDLVRAYGHYHETYRKEDGEWRIRTVHLTRLRITQVLKGQNRL